MIDLERALVDLAARLDIPGEDLVAARVAARLDERAASPIRRPTRTPARLAVRLAVAAVVVAAVLAGALPGPRRAVARWLGFDSVRIERVPSAPATATTVTSTTVTAATEPTPTTRQPSVAMADAIAATGLPDPSPALLGAPTSVQVVHPPQAGQIVVAYAPSALVPASSVSGVGALVSVMPATIVEGFFSKLLGDEATVEHVDVGGDAGYWIEGSPHQVMFDVDGEILPQTLRLATNTLLWQHGDVVYRIEADVSRATALQIAASIR